MTKLIRHVEPSMILAYGNGSYSAYSFLLDKAGTGAKFLPCSGQVINKRGWKCKAFEMLLFGRRVRVVGIPHLSRPLAMAPIYAWLKPLFP